MIADWNGVRIKQVCGSEYGLYKKELDAHYAEYFARNPELGSCHPQKAADLESALPRGWSDLESMVDPKELHIHHLSGKSSQILGLGLIGPAIRKAPQGDWLWGALDPALPPPSSVPQMRLEVAVTPELLGERPRQTAVDLLVESEDQLLCIEMKWSEESLGTCSCKPARVILDGECSERVRSRRRYWDAAREALLLPDLTPGAACPISWNYQAVRNIAAADALASDGQTPVFGLIYDERNPYFGGCGEWPGWPTVLDETIRLSDSRVRFASCSWQELAPRVFALSGMEEVTRWAGEKHGLV